MWLAKCYYPLLDGRWIVISYDRDAPCWSCGNPVGNASCSGTVICPSCDSNPSDGYESLERARRYESYSLQAHNDVIEARGIGVEIPPVQYLDSAPAENWWVDDQKDWFRWAYTRNAGQGHPPPESLVESLF